MLESITFTFVSLLCLGMICIGTEFSDFDYCNLNCPKILHPACPQPCLSNECIFMPSTYEFRADMMSFHNRLRDRVASGEFAHLSPAADMRALSYDMELEFFAYCWAEKNQSGGNICAKTRKEELVEQSKIVVTENTVNQSVLEAAFNLWVENYKTVTPAVINNFQPSMTGRKKHVNETYLTCYYTPPGNVRGYPVYTIGDPTSGCVNATPNENYHHLCGKAIMPLEARYILKEGAIQFSCETRLLCVNLLVILFITIL